MFIYYERRPWKLVVGLLLVLAAINAGQMALFGAVRQVISTAVGGRLVPIYYVATDEKKVALSLDAVWGADYTDQILDTFDKHHVKTTFFLAGFWLEKFPDRVREIAKRGHEIGNHTYSHPHLNSLSPAEIRTEVMRTHEMIEAITGRKARLFRPPFGEYSNKVIEVAKECGYETIMWSIDSLDWRDLSAGEIVDRVMGKMHNGAIVLFHNNGTHTAEALTVIIPELLRQGYKIVPISDLLLKGDYYIHPHTGEQRPIEKPKPVQRPRPEDQLKLERRSGDERS
ncbi:MAG: polysaccharide deacetylase family protein [Firmicutes bacterium]|nr:polysaccharide deacetylase family protein [Bacillota bacterium]